MRAAYMFRGQLWYANRAAGENPTYAVARSLKRRLGAGINLYYQERDDLGREVWNVRWFDGEVFREDTVVL